MVYRGLETLEPNILILSIGSLYTRYAVKADDRLVLTIEVGISVGYFLLILKQALMGKLCIYLNFPNDTSGVFSIGDVISRAGSF